VLVRERWRKRMMRGAGKMEKKNDARFLGNKGMKMMLKTHLKIFFFFNKLDLNKCMASLCMNERQLNGLYIDKETAG
jgi:hypothetical protein